jgi:hypothetical protein
LLQNIFNTKKKTMKKLLLAFLLFTTVSATPQLKAISVNLYNGTNLMDGCAVLYNGQMWADAVTLDDSRKITNPLENIAIIKGKDTMAIEKRTTYSTVNLSLYNISDGTHSLKIKSVGITTAFLQDGDKLTHIKDSIIYPFTVQRNFKIIFCSVLNIPVQQTVNQNQQQRPTQTDENYRVYNTLGQLVYKRKTKPAGNQWKLLRYLGDNIYVCY